jgi:DNA-binding transcriptional regulator YiaG
VVTAQTEPGNGSGAGSGDAGNATADLAPGERLAGVVGVQGAEIEGEVESRAFEVALRESETNESRAAVVADRVNRTEERLAELERRQEELRERRDAGELSQGAYAARMATTTARIETLSRGLNRSASVAAELPAAVRNETGVDGERLATLRERANELSGPEVAALARGVAGEGVGGPVGPDRRGPPGNGTERGPPGDAGPPGEGAVGGGPGNGSTGATGTGNGSAGAPGRGNGSVGTPGTGNGSTGAPGAENGSGSGTANGSGSGTANGSGPSGQPGGGNATDSPAGSGNGTGTGSGSGSAGAGGDGSDGGGGAPSIEVTSDTPSIAAGSPSRLDA